MKELIICLLGWTSVAAYAAFEFWWIRRQSANANKLEAKESFWNYSSAMPPLSLAIVWLSLVFSQLRLEQNPEVGATFRQEKQTWSDLFDCIELLNMTVRECIPIGLVFLSFYKVAYLYDYRQEKSNHCESDSLVFLVLRNSIVWMLLQAVLCWIYALCDCPDGTSIWSDVPLWHAQVPTLASKFTLYHSKQSLLVRLSHALSTIMQVIRWTRPRMVDVILWSLFEAIVDEGIGDMAHYIDNPGAAMDRATFEVYDLCQMDQKFIRQLVDFPINSVCLASSLCDEF